MDVEAYTGYVISVQACNDPKLCSDLSESIPVTTKIGGMCLTEEGNNEKFLVNWFLGILFVEKTRQQLFNSF